MMDQAYQSEKFYAPPSAGSVLPGFPKEAPIPAFNINVMRDELCELLNIARETRIELEAKVDSIQGRSALDLANGIAYPGEKSSEEPSIRDRFNDLRGEIIRLSKASGRL